MNVWFLKDSWQTIFKTDSITDSKQFLEKSSMCNLLSILLSISTMGSWGMPRNNVKLSHFTNTKIYAFVLVLKYFLILWNCCFFGRRYLYSFCKGEYSRKYLRLSSHHFSAISKERDVSHLELTWHKNKAWLLSAKDSAIPMKSETLQRGELKRKIMILLKRKQYFSFYQNIILYQKLI